MGGVGKAVLLLGTATRVLLLKEAIKDLLPVPLSPVRDGIMYR
jgi:hypothetical protein